MPFGDPNGGRPNILEGGRLEKFLLEYGEQFDHIIMDGHSLTGADTSMVASKFDGIALVVECEKTKWEIVKEASQKMTLTGGNVLGVILNRRKFYIPKFVYKKV